jgi:hypothetical protein
VWGHHVGSCACAYFHLFFFVLLGQRNWPQLKDGGRVSGEELHRGDCSQRPRVHEARGQGAAGGCTERSQEHRDGGPLCGQAPHGSFRQRRRRRSKENEEDEEKQRLVEEDADENSLGLPHSCTPFFSFPLETKQFVPAEQIEEMVQEITKDREAEAGKKKPAAEAASS